MQNTNQHYIPKFLIRRFAEEKFGVCVYLILKDRILINQNPRNFAACRYMYNLDETELKEVLEQFILFYPQIVNALDFSDPLFIEKYFSRIEGEVNQLFTRILQQDHLVLSLEDKFKLIIFLHDLAYRTKFYRETLDMIAENSNSIINDIGKANNMTEKELKKSYFEVGTKSHIKHFFDLRSFVEFSNMILSNYEFCYAKNQGVVDFILSDNPAFQISMGMNDFCFPISPKRAIVLRCKNRGAKMICSIPNIHHVLLLNSNNVMEYNISNAAFSYEFLFGTYITLKTTLDKYTFGHFEFN